MSYNSSDFTLGLPVPSTNKGAIRSAPAPGFEITTRQIKSVLFFEGGQTFIEMSRVLELSLLLFCFLVLMLECLWSPELNIPLRWSCILLSLFEGEREREEESDGRRRGGGEGKRVEEGKKEKVEEDKRGEEEEEKDDSSKILKNVFFNPFSLPASFCSILVVNYRFF